MRPNAASARSLDDDLHAEVGDVPPRVGDDQLEQPLQVGVRRVRQLELLVEVAGVDLDVAGLVDHLRGAVELGLEQRHLLHELGRRQQRTLLAVEELAT